MPPNDPSTSDEAPDPNLDISCSRVKLPDFVHEEAFVIEMASGIRDEAFEFMQEMHVREEFEEYHNNFVNFLRSQECTDWWRGNDIFSDYLFHTISYCWNTGRSPAAEIKLPEEDIPQSYWDVIDTMLNGPNRAAFPPEWFELVKECGLVTAWDVYRYYDLDVDPNRYLYVADLQVAQCVNVVHTALSDEKLSKLLTFAAVKIKMSQ